MAYNRLACPSNSSASFDMVLLRDEPGGLHKCSPPQLCTFQPWPLQRWETRWAAYCQAWDNLLSSLAAGCTDLPLRRPLR